MRDIALIVVLLAAGCSPSRITPEDEPIPPISNHSIGHWTNKYHGNSKLVGIHIQQFPDCEGEAKLHEGRHPAMIIYLFSDGRCNQVGYGPDGSIDEDFWYNKADVSCDFDCSVAMVNHE